MARTNVSVDQTVFEEFSTQAKQQNKTLFAFANESLTAIAKICSEGGSPTELYSLWRTVSILRQIDVITLPSDFVDELISKLYATDRVSVLKMFQNLGSSLVGLLKIAAEDLDNLGKLAKDFTIILPVKQFKISKPDANTAELDIVGAGRKKESTECTFEFVKSVLNGYGYTVTKQEIGIGTLRIWASKRTLP
jgi:hypothetical protein